MCDFPAATLLKMKREVCLRADKSGDPEEISNAAQFAMDVDRVRLSHEELTGCDCWYEAIEEADNASVAQS